MKRFLILAFLLSFILLNLATSHATEETQAFENGLTFYKSGDFEKALPDFTKAVEQSPEDPAARLFLAKTLYELGRIDQVKPHLDVAYAKMGSDSSLQQAIGLLYYELGDYPQSAKIFKRLSQQQPDKMLFKYYAGMSYAKMNQTGQSFEYLKVSQDTKKVKYQDILKDPHDIDSLLQYAQNGLKQPEAEQKPYRLVLKLGYQIDDNVLLAYDGETIPGTQKGKDDTATVAFVYGEYRFLQKEHYHLGLGLSHFQNWHKDWSEFDLSATMLRVFGNYYFGRYGVGFNYFPTLFRVDKENYLKRHKIGPSFSMQINPDLIGRISYNFYKDDNQDDDARSATAHEALFDVKYRLGKGLGHVLAQAGYKDNSANQAEFSYSEVHISLGIALNLFFDIDCLAQGEYSEKKYDIDRQDTDYELNVALSHSIYWDWLLVSAEYLYDQNDSNVTAIVNNNSKDIYSYKRNVVTLSLVANF